VRTTLATRSRSGRDGRLRLAAADPRTVVVVGSERNGDDGSDEGVTFVGPDATAARLDALMARPGAERVAKIRAQMADADSADLWADLVGPFYDTAKVAGVLGVTVAAVRSRHARGSLLALRAGSGAWVYPVWQFDGDVLPGLAKVLKVLGDGVSGWSVLAWLRSPESELGGRTPLEVLRSGGEGELVLLVASHAAAGWV